MRVACFPDSFHEINGVAHTSRQFHAFARRRNLPLLCVPAGSRKRLRIQNQLRTLELLNDAMCHAQMRTRARSYALSASRNTVFEKVLCRDTKQEERGKQPGKSVMRGNSRLEMLPQY